MNNNLLGISSFAFRHAVRSPTCPMDAQKFIVQAYELGFHRALLCENLGYEFEDAQYFIQIARYITERNIVAEVGMRGFGLPAIERHINIARQLNATLIRTVLGPTGAYLPTNPLALKEDAKRSIAQVAPMLERNTMYLGIENNFDLSVTDLVEVVTSVGSPNVGLIFDSTNCLGLLEEPYHALSMMGEYLLSAHIKDYLPQKVEGGYLFGGVDLGSGLLDIPTMLHKVTSLNPEASIIMEYSLKPEETLGIDRVLAWELEVATKNANYLKKLCKQE